MADYRLDHDPALPMPFQTGAVGWFGYDLAHHLERLPHPAHGRHGLSDLALGFYDAILAFDLLERRAWILSSGWPEGTPEAAMHRRRARADQLAAVLGHAATPAPEEPDPPVEPRSNFIRAGYEAAVRRWSSTSWPATSSRSTCRSVIWPSCSGWDAWRLYRRLRRRNPAPFAAYLELGGYAGLASPERFLELRGRQVETRPIKGTRPRGATPDDDARLGHELLASEKDRAENVMIVDLLRNDLGRVCRDRTVLTPEICELESFATVHHLVSTRDRRLPGP